MVVYGFHGWPELYSSEVGEAIEKNPPSGVQTLRYNPKEIGDGHEFHRSSRRDQERVTLRARKGAREFLRREYPNHFVIDLHDTPEPLDDKESTEKLGYPQFYITYPDWNVRLGQVIANYEKRRIAMGSRVYAMGDWPGNYMGYHSATVDFFPMLLQRNGEMLYLSKADGIDYLTSFMRTIRRDYLRKEAGMPVE